MSSLCDRPPPTLLTRMTPDAFFWTLQTRYAADPNHPERALRGIGRYPHRCREKVHPPPGSVLRARPLIVRYRRAGTCSCGFGACGCHARSRSRTRPSPGGLDGRRVAVGTVAPGPDGAHGRTIPARSAQGLRRGRSLMVQARLLGARGDRSTARGDRCRGRCHKCTDWRVHNTDLDGNAAAAAQDPRVACRRPHPILDPARRRSAGVLVAGRSGACRLPRTSAARHANGSDAADRQDPLSVGLPAGHRLAGLDGLPRAGLVSED